MANLTCRDCGSNFQNLNEGKRGRPATRCPECKEKKSIKGTIE